MIGLKLKNNMEQEPPSSSQPELPDFERATDMEIADFLMQHIDKPCEAEVKPGEVENIRQFYLNEAESVLAKFENPFAAELLKEKIDQYKDEEK
jgi:hypothetical protein